MRPAFSFQKIVITLVVLLLAITLGLLVAGVIAISVGWISLSC